MDEDGPMAGISRIKMIFTMRNNIFLCGKFACKMNEKKPLTDYATAHYQYIFYCHGASCTYRFRFRRLLSSQVQWHMWRVASATIMQPVFLFTVFWLSVSFQNLLGLLAH